ncbi:hypothetical protein EUX98_g6231 [Antrodiella citrinella]|uniref:DUF6589 domain-containing protein n=1 Tax=Antrodiella citrinella TaxID=2447956 RepID=A0A4S4MPU1_9APHY|nr:hypothetical protein EUX98_g6231 [Antrodiella citrinella]
MRGRKAAAPAQAHAANFTQAVGSESLADVVQQPEDGPSSQRRRGGQPGPRESYSERRTKRQKLDALLEAVSGSGINWSMSDFLEYFFQPQLKNRSPSHRAALQRFLKGGTRHTPLTVVKMIYQNKLGRPPPGHRERNHMFSPEMNAEELSYAQPAISTWAADIVASRLIEESNKLVHEKAGLRVRASRKVSQDSNVPSVSPDAPPSETEDSTAAPLRRDASGRFEARFANDLAAEESEDEEVPGLEDDGVDPEDDEGSIAVSVEGLMFSDDEGQLPPIPRDNSRVEPQVMPLSISDDDENGEWEDEPVNNSTPSPTQLNQDTATANAGPNSTHAAVQSPSETSLLHTTTASSRAGARRRRAPTSDPTVDWDIISKFSLESLMEKYTDLAPLTVWLLFRAIQPREPKRAAKRRNRPKWIVIASIISEMLYARNSWVNLLPMCRSISLFASKAHQSTYRVGSRFAHCTPYSTTRRALVEMARAKRLQFLTAQELIQIVLDNLQAWAARRDQRIGNESKMIIGTGATAIKLEDCPPGVLDFDAWQAKREEGLKERENFTVDDLLADIDVEHLKAVGVLHWLDTLVFYVPALAGYRSEMAKIFDSEVQKHQINPNRRTDVQPLGTNSANETTTKGMKDALFDFFGQAGITEETVKAKREAQLVSGDGKSFENIGKTKQYLGSQEGEFESLKFVYEMLEIWHTKWTDLGRSCNGKWGQQADTTDPSTLGFLAKTVNSPVPSDKKKPDFYPNARLMEIGVKTHMLHCWETYLDVNDLEVYFSRLSAMDKLPSLVDLRRIAGILYDRYSTTAAYEIALENQTAFKEHPCAVPPKPIFTAAPPAESSSDSEMDDLEGVPDVMMNIDDPDVILADNAMSGDSPMAAETVPPAEDDGGSSTSQSEPANSEDDPSAAKVKFEGDWPLANSIILMRDGIWFMEVCRAVALGDIGRVWEVLKVWILTFSGGGNTNYVAYLLEMYCKITLETPEPMRLAIFSNWLVNLEGKPGHFHELDLMQEHFNFWLEELAQHKGKEFDDEWYREVLSMHVHHFLRLKEEMEAAVHMAPRSKTHTEPHLQNEYREALRVFREYDLHRHHAGRDLGHHTQDDFARGVANLGRTKKVADVIANALRTRDNAEKEIKGDGKTPAADPRTYMCTPMYYRDGKVVIPRQEEED